MYNEAGIIGPIFAQVFRHVWTWGLLCRYCVRVCTAHGALFWPFRHTCFPFSSH